MRHIIVRWKGDVSGCEIRDGSSKQDSGSLETRTAVLDGQKGQ